MSHLPAVKTGGILVALAWLAGCVHGPRTFPSLKCCVKYVRFGWCWKSGNIIREGNKMERDREKRSFALARVRTRAHTRNTRARIPHTTPHNENKTKTGGSAIACIYWHQVFTCNITTPVASGKIKTRMPSVLLLLTTNQKAHRHLINVLQYRNHVYLYLGDGFVLHAGLSKSHFLSFTVFSINLPGNTLIGIRLVCYKNNIKSPRSMNWMNVFSGKWWRRRCRVRVGRMFYNIIITFLFFVSSSFYPWCGVSFLGPMRKFKWADFR